MSNEWNGAPRTAGRPGMWLIAGTPVEEQYPCRCAERRFRVCSAVFCPCAGREDPPNSNCCGTRYRPEDVAREAAAWRAKREAERAGRPDDDE